MQKVILSLMMIMLATSVLAFEDSLNEGHEAVAEGALATAKRGAIVADESKRACQVKGKVADYFPHEFGTSPAKKLME